MHFNHHFLKRRIMSEYVWLQLTRQNGLVASGPATPFGWTWLREGTRELATKLFRSRPCVLLRFERRAMKVHVDNSCRAEDERHLRYVGALPKASAWTHLSTGRYARCPRGCLQQRSDHPVQRLPELHTARGDCLCCPEIYNLNILKT